MNDPAAPPSRAALRQSWAVHDSTPIVALLGEPVPTADAWTAAMAVGLVRTASGQRLRLLVHPQQHHRARTQDHLDRGPDADLFIQEPRLTAPPTVLPGCDAILFVGSAPHRAATHHATQRAPAQALASGLPIVAPDTPAHRAAFTGATDQVSFAPRGEIKKLADRLMHNALGLAGLGKSFVPPAVPGMTQIS